MPDKGGQFDPVLDGHIHPVWGGQFSRSMHSEDELIIQEFVDENGKSFFACKNKNRITIAKYANNVIEETEQTLYTYYVYDTLNRLRYIIPPEAFFEMVDNTDYDFSWNDSFTNKYIYCFKYDEKGRLIEKKVPGKETEYFIYDNLDRVIMAQDGNLRNDDLWNFVKYDVHGRKVTSGLFDAGSTVSRSQMQSNANTYYNQNPGYNFEIPIAFTQNYEGYSFRSYPNTYSNAEVLIVNYYDDYRFDQNNDYDYQRIAKLNMPANPSSDINGFATGVKKKILDSSPEEWLFTVYYYDDKNRILQTISDNHIGGQDNLSSEIYFDGKIKQTKHSHDDGSTTMHQYRRYTYDHAGRVLSLKYGINTQSKFLMYSNKYNEIGQVIEKNLHSDDDGVSFWQSLDYKYNIRGWLTQINQSNLYNNNNIIIYDEYLEDDEMVDGLIYDSVIFVVDTVRNNLIELDIYDYKDLYITEIDDTSSHRTLSVDETQLVEMEEEASDSTEFHSIKSITGDSLVFNFKGYFIDKYAEQNTIIDSIKSIVEENLISLGYTDTNIINSVNQKMLEFTKSRVALVYFNEDSDDLFGMDILYDKGFNALNGDSQYNGIISGVKWQTAYNTGIRGYGYSYDEFYQMTDAEYGLYNQGWSNDNRYGVYDITYDRNGNIKTLKRKGLQRYDGSTPEFGLIDDLDYSYIGNQLDAVEDDTDGITFQSNDFRDNSSTGSDEYEYDDNGNLISDDNKGITQIKYNYLNLPTEIKWDATHKIEFTYDATGRKLKKKITSGTNVTTIDYVGNVIYENSSIKLILTEEGRMVPEEGTSDYVPQYFLRDHLGNIRVCFTDTDNDDVADVIQENHLYPYGMTMGDLNYIADVENKYLYQGKENIDDLGLYWYEFGARMFDEQIGRWHVGDALNQYLNPYIAMSNNPSNEVDPTGLWALGGPLFYIRQLEAYQRELQAQQIAWQNELDWIYGRGIYGGQGPGIGWTVNWFSQSGGGGSWLATHSESGNTISTVEGFHMENPADTREFYNKSKGESGRYIQISGTLAMQMVDGEVVAAYVSDVFCIWVPAGNPIPAWNDQGWQKAQPGTNDPPNTNAYNNVVSDVGLGIALETLLVGSAASGATSSLVSKIFRGSMILGGVTGTIENSYSAYQAFANGNYYEGAFQTAQAVSNVIGVVFLFTPAAPVGIGIITVNSFVDIGEYYYKNW